LVTATDSAGEESAPVTLTVLQKVDALTTDFPEGNDGPWASFERGGIEWHKDTNRLFVSKTGVNQPNQVVAVDIDTGTRTVFVGEDQAFSTFSMLKLLPEQNALLVGDRNSDAIFNIDLETTNFTVLTDNSSLDSNVNLSSPYAMELGTNGLLYVADAGARFYSVNMDSGARSLVSGATRPDSGENPFTNPMGLVLDEANNRALLTDYTAKQLLWVDLTTGARTVWVDSDQLDQPFDIKHDADDNRIILTDGGVEAILAVSLSTGELTTLSGANVPASGANSLEIPWSVVIDEEADIAFVGSLSRVGDSGDAAILLVDLTTGERIVVSRSSDG